MRIQRIQVKSSSENYSVLCGSGVLRVAAQEIHRLGKFSSVQIVSSPKVWRAVEKSIPRNFAKIGPAKIHLFDDAESKKNLQTVESLTRALTRAGADRHALLIAAGGGVVGDVAGFVAAGYLRGIALAHIPTTLVAQVDSAIGGKTGVNLPEGKNLFGAFYPPRLVLADSQVLRTLPPRELRSGLAEVIKYGVIADAKLFAYLESNMERILQRDPAALARIIPRCAELKAQVVSRDERESGQREILNFGHTFGHALESITNYRVFRHGEAVAWGMMAAALLGHEAGITSASDAARIISLTRRIGPLPPWPSSTPQKLIVAMRADKKSRSGKLRFVLSPAIGKAQSYDAISLDDVEHVLHYGPQLLSNETSSSKK
jgi:3-dehydroquinate synthase